MLTADDLLLFGVAPPRAEAFIEPLRATCTRFAINTPARIAAFVAQCAVESDGLSALEERLSYRSVERITAVFRRLADRPVAQLQCLVRDQQALANAAYAGINGNGDEASGDGWRYRGRGLIQLTGRANYEAAQIGLGRPYVGSPELVAAPEDACLTAGFYWHKRGLNGLADHGDIDGITRAVNGRGMHKAMERREIYARAMSLMGAA